MIIKTRRHCLAPADAADGAGRSALRQVASVYRYHVGRMLVTALHDGHNPLALSDAFIPAATLDEVQRELRAACLPEDTLNIPFTPILLETGGELVLIDSGFGDGGPPTAGQMRGNLFYYMHYDANLSIAANPETRLYVDGIQAGTGKVMLTLPPGIYRVKSEEPGAGNRTRRIELTDTRLVHLNMHIQPTRGEIRLLSWIPGASQYRKREITKSAAFAATVYGGMVTSVILHNRWKSRQNEFNRLRDEYWLANNESEVIRLGEQARSAEKRANNTGRQLTWAIGATAVLYAWNVFDGLQTPRMGYLTEDTFNPYIVLDAGSSTPLLGMRVNF